MPGALGGVEPAVPLAVGEGEVLPRTADEVHDRAVGHARSDSLVGAVDLRVGLRKSYSICIDWSPGALLLNEFFRKKFDPISNYFKQK